MDGEMVREINVFLAPSMDDTKFYYVHYPLKPSWLLYAKDEKTDLEIQETLGRQYPLTTGWNLYNLPEDRQQVRFKSEGSKMEFHFSVDSELNTLPNNITKLTLRTIWAQPPIGVQQLIGFMIGSQLHVHPLQNFVHLRPSRKHLNAQNLNVAGDEEGMVAPNALGQEKPKMVLIQFPFDLPHQRGPMGVLREYESGTIKLHVGETVYDVFEAAKTTQGGDFVAVGSSRSCFLGPCVTYYAATLDI